jgi:phosphoglycerate dehydrogenase-like enzyme
MPAKVIVDPNFRLMDEIFSPRDRKRLYEICEVVWGRDDFMPMDQFLAALPDAEAVICTNWRYGDVYGQAGKLRAIFDVEGAFPMNVDYDQCYQRKIRVLSIAPSFARQVAEMALGMTLGLIREIALGDRLFRENREIYLHAGNVGNYMLYGKTVGMIGYGSIARALRPLLIPFGVNILAYDPWLSDGIIRLNGGEPVSLETVLSQSDVIYVLAAPTAENRAFLSREQFALIKPNAALLVLSRAHVVDFDALTEFVMANKFRMATDVFPTEPLAADHPIRHADNVIMSAHRAGSVQEGLWEIGEMVLDDLEMILRGMPPQRLPVAQPEVVKRLAPIAVPGGR